MLLMDTGKIRVEYDGLYSRLHVYKDGLYVGCESLAECIRHMLDESPVEEYRKDDLRRKGYCPERPGLG
ncbi:MAG: hypothetical protein HY890_03475 [Deltaproteobacteria bacterium]|nr:hypothetical protein [Deltaproteobacteria bacterium]